MTGRHRLRTPPPPAPITVGSACRLGIRQPLPCTPAGLVAPGRVSPTELGGKFDPDDVLASLPRWGWTMLAYGERSRPDLLVAYYLMGDYVDVFATRGPDRCGAYRARIWPEQDPVDVYGITWCQVGDLTTVLWGLLNLSPVQRGWPDRDVPAALRMLLPNPTQCRYTIRPPQ
ncbi:MAG TPA: hypothetical protein VFW65_40885 [Pseudonocardiaceae bacterium]|nr:hypothetical protein [Pseudonocardiaceae bacterium]